MCARSVPQKGISMTTTLATVDQSVSPLPVQVIKANRALVQQLMREAMRKDIHYGTVPGTDKDTLYKAGSELILSMFRLAVRPVIEDLSTDDYVKYRVRCDLTVNGSDMIVGSGVGECSSQEEKYQWRAAVCHEEWEEQNALGQARIKWKRGYNDGPPQRIEQVRVNWADIANTVLKMAKKRAQIDATLTATGCSDVFTQDMDDEGEERAERKQRNGGAASDAPTIKPNQAGMFYHRWKEKNIPEAKVRAYLKEVIGVDDSRKIPATPKTIFDAALAWVAAGGPDWAKKKEEPPPKKEAQPAQQQRQQQQEQQHTQTGFAAADPSLQFSPFPDDDSDTRDYSNDPSER
jgi:hypothetical protein